jgi:hypothetical protein
MVPTAVRSSESLDRNQSLAQPFVTSASESEPATDFQIHVVKSMIAKNLTGRWGGSQPGLIFRPCRRKHSAHPHDHLRGRFRTVRHMHAKELRTKLTVVP